MPTNAIPTNIITRSQMVMGLTGGQIRARAGLSSSGTRGDLGARPWARGSWVR